MTDIGHNNPVASPEVAAEMMKDALEPWQARCAEFETKADTLKVTDMDEAAQAVDFIRMARALSEKAGSLSQEVCSPFTDAAGAARNVAIRFNDRLIVAMEKAQAQLDDYNQEKRRKAAALREEQRAEEQRLRDEAAARDGKVPPEPTPEPTPEPEAPMRIRTDLGGVATIGKKWRPEVFDVTKVPVEILNTPKVKEAIGQVARSMMQNGMTVAGVRKQEYDSTTIR